MAKNVKDIDPKCFWCGTAQTLNHEFIVPVCAVCLEDLRKQKM